MPARVRVQFYSQLRHVAGHTLDVDLAEGATVADLLEKVYDGIPALRAHDKTILVGAGVEFVERDYRIKPGDEIAIMPPVQGG
jgi:molybdopterin converting factor small subunit